MISSSALQSISDEDLAFSRLLSYVVYQWPAYQIAPHHRKIAQALHRVERGEIKRLMMFLPPRHGKSMLASEFFPAWYLGRNPNHQIIHVTYGQELADGFGRKVRNQIADPVFSQIFDNVQPAKDSLAAHRFHTTDGGVYHAVGVGGPITGRGSDLLLIDDPIRGREDADSETYRRKMRDWYQAVAYTRLMPGGAIVLIQTRWHQDDLAGWLLSEHAEENWEVISLPAVNESGKALWPEAFPIETLNKIKSAIGSRDWNALYQQNPIPDDGGLVKIKWFGRYDTLPESFDRIVHSWDTAQKPKQINDPSVGMVFGIRGSQYFLIDVFRDRCEYPELKRAVVDLANGAYCPNAILIEDKVSGISLVQELRRIGMPPVIAIKPDKDKIMRMNRVTPMIESGRVFLPYRARWLPEFESEISAFPLGKNDDQCDALSQFLAWQGLSGAKPSISGTRLFGTQAHATRVFS